ncbi:MAG: hypothetical protein SFY69_11395 [Planctomycetota bacterium]|nr:hypothetical protein [Planctomycetota bacterium]
MMLGFSVLILAMSASSALEKNPAAAPACPPWSMIVDPAEGMATDLDASFRFAELRVARRSAVDPGPRERRLVVGLSVLRPAAVLLVGDPVVVTARTDNGRKIECVAEFSRDATDISLIIEGLPKDVRWVSFDTSVSCIA